MSVRVLTTDQQGQLSQEVSGIAFHRNGKDYVLTSADAIFTPSASTQTRILLDQGESVELLPVKIDWMQGMALFEIPHRSTNLTLPELSIAQPRIGERISVAQVPSRILNLQSTRHDLLSRSTVYEISAEGLSYSQKMDLIVRNLNNDFLGFLTDRFVDVIPNAGYRIGHFRDESPSGRHRGIVIPASQIISFIESSHSPVSNSHFRWTSSSLMNGPRRFESENFSYSPMAQIPSGSQREYEIGGATGFLLGFYQFMFFLASVGGGDTPGIGGSDSVDISQLVMQVDKKTENINVLSLHPWEKNFLNKTLDGKIKFAFLYRRNGDLFEIQRVKTINQFSFLVDPKNNPIPFQPLIPFQRGSLHPQLNYSEDNNNSIDFIFHNLFSSQLSKENYRHVVTAKLLLETEQWDQVTPEDFRKLIPLVENNYVKAVLSRHANFIENVRSKQCRFLLE